MINNINYKKWFEVALAKNFTALEILIDKNHNMTINLEDGKIHENVQSVLCTATIIGLYQNKKSSIYLEKIDESKIEETLELMKNQILVLNLKEKDIIFKGSSVYPDIKEYNFDFSSLDIHKKYDLLFQLEKELTKSIFLKKIDTISYNETYFQKKLINSEGLFLEKQGSFSSIYVDCVFQKDREIEVISKNFPVKRFSEFNICNYAQEIISLGEKKLEAQSLQSKSYLTVFSNEIFAKLLQKFSSIFSGINAYRGLTKLKDKIGKKIASSQVTLIDDPLCEKAFFQYKFDDEGVACYTKTIIEKGNFKQFIHNLKTSLIFNIEPTGNCFNNSILMSNCYLKEGNKSFDQMIAPIQEGIYIDFLIGLHAGINVVNGDFSLQASGFLIDKGKITTPVKMIVVSGNFFDLLLNVKDIANDLIFTTSRFGSPSVYAGYLSIAGETKI